MVLMLVSMFAGCGKSVDKNNNVVNGKFTEYLVAEKVGTLNRDDFLTDEGGVYYKGDNDLWGIMSFNGAIDSGAIYTSVTPKEQYFQVRTKEPTGTNDFAGLNSSSLVDCKGKVVISGYACYSILNERYIHVAKVTERSYSKEDTVASYTDNGLCFNGQYDEYAWYKGDWYVFDIITEQLVPGATGKTNTIVSASGRYVKFSDAEGNRIRINEKGESLPEGAKLFEDGSYYVEGKVGEVFDSNGNLLFDFELSGFIPSSISNGYYVATKYTDDGSKYAVMDKTGKVISTEFDDYISIYGNIVLVENKVCNLEGEVVLEGEYESVYFDKMFENNWMVRNDDYYTLIDKDGKVFFNGPSNDDYTVWTDDFLASKKTDDGYFYYSHKDQDYTIKGNHFAPWIVKTSNSNSLYDLVDTMTGKKLLEGYSDYSSISRNSLAYYVYAKYNGGADVYLVVSSAQLEDVATRKTNLFDELIAAFEAEGIKVTVDKETGEMALDSSVLFGGDSAELTTDGKTFLNKFIKVYTNVAYSDKYAGFISKTIVEGHTAPVEGSTYASGLKLSEERAANVKNYCLSAETGVDISKISKTLEDVGYSNSKPVYDANGKTNLAASRRVSFRFIVSIDF